jgi:hypothetical protein
MRQAIRLEQQQMRKRKHTFFVFSTMLSEVSYVVLLVVLSLLCFHSFRLSVAVCACGGRGVESSVGGHG